MKIFPGILLVILLSVQNLPAQTADSFAIEKSSFVAIRGSSNISKFDLNLNGEHIPGNIFTVSPTQDQNKIKVSQNSLPIYAKNFTSKNKMALRDFLKLIKSDLYPIILVQLSSVELQPEMDKTQFTEINVSANTSGSITLAGVKRQYCFPISYSRKGDIFSADGNIRLSIRDFGLEPPVALLGLMRVDEWIQIQIHIICKKMDKTPPQ